MMLVLTWISLLCGIQAAALNSDVWLQVSEYLPVKDWLLTASVSKELGFCNKFGLRRIIQERFDPLLLQVLSGHETEALARILLIHEHFNFQRASFRSMRMITFHRRSKKHFWFLLKFYSHKRLHFRDPERSHELYLNEDCLSALIRYHQTDLWAFKAILDLTYHPSIDSLLAHYNLYRNYLKPVTKALIVKLRSKVHERNFRVEAILLSRIK